MRMVPFRAERGTPGEAGPTAEGGRPRAAGPTRLQQLGLLIVASALVLFVLWRVVR